MFTRMSVCAGSIMTCVDISQSVSLSPSSDRERERERGRRRIKLLWCNSITKCLVPKLAHYNIYGFRCVNNDYKYYLRLYAPSMGGEFAIYTPKVNHSFFIVMPLYWVITTCFCHAPHRYASLETTWRSVDWLIDRWILFPLTAFFRPLYTWYFDMLNKKADDTEHVMKKSLMIIDTFCNLISAGFVNVGRGKKIQSIFTVFKLII